MGVYGTHNIFLIDSWQASVQSYFTQTDNTHINASYAVPVTPMIADIIAIRDLYGTPGDINAGDTVYGYRSNLDGYLGQVFELWAGVEDPFAGISSMDDLDILSQGDNVRISLSGTDYSTTIILTDFDVSNLDATDFLF